MDDDGAIVGHVMLSYAHLGDRIACCSSRRSPSGPTGSAQGIGDALTRAALELADERGEPLVLVLGHPDYYPRFGFEPARALGIEPDIDGCRTRRGW